MKLVKNKVISALLAGMMLFSATAAPTAIQKFTGSEEIGIVSNIEASAAQTVTGCFQNDIYKWTYGTTVYSNNSRKNASVRICTFDLMGWRSGATVDVAVYNRRGNCVAYYDGYRTSRNFSLPKGSDRYTVKIRCHNYCAKKNNWWNQATNFDNGGKCVYWSIDAKSNCRL